MAAEEEALATRIARDVRPSLVSIFPGGRDGAEAGIGSGFVIDSGGLIATNFHVIGERRPLRIEDGEGRSLDVTAIHAWDRERDLAILRVAATDLPALKLGDSTAIQQGDYAAAMGNPLGFQFSIVEGIISARRTQEGSDMLQLAMPIERGNSGGPVLNRASEVTGIVTLKSAATPNLGFAVPSEALRALMAKPSPILMENWLTIGALRPETWKPTGATWTQRAGIIRAHGMRPGAFGGRTVCVHQVAPPPLPYELSVRVRLDNEAGAAGLAFCSDGADVHYGFYPTNGSLRLTRFEGPDISTWTILEQTTSEAYRPHDWNDLRVRLEADRILCYVNDVLVISSSDTALREGGAGLCKFRTTTPEFRDFSLGNAVASPTAPSLALTDAIRTLAEGQPVIPALESTLARESASARPLLERESRALEKRAAALRATAARIHQQDIAAQLAGVLAPPAATADLIPRAALLLAKLDNPDVNIDANLATLERMGQALAAAVTAEEKADPARALAALHRWMFEQNGFHGSQHESFHAANSYLNEVLDDREGLPITLSIIHRALAAHLGLNVTGRSFPGRFMNHLTLPGDPARDVYIDVANHGAELTRAEVIALLDSPIPPEAWEPTTPTEIILRMFNNLTADAEENDDVPRAVTYLNTALTIDPNAVAQRLQRLRLHGLTRQRAALETDAQWFFDHQPPGVNLEFLQKLLDN
jgi:serine protease Do